MKKIILLIGVLAISLNAKEINPYIDGYYEWMDSEVKTRQYNKSMLGMGLSYQTNGINFQAGLELTDFKQGLEYQNHTQFIVPKIGVIIDKNLIINYKYEDNELSGVKQNIYVRYNF